MSLSAPRARCPGEVWGGWVDLYMHKIQKIKCSIEKAKRWTFLTNEMLIIIILKNPSSCIVLPLLFESETVSHSCRLSMFEKLTLHLSRNVCIQRLAKPKYLFSMHRNCFVITIVYSERRAINFFFNKIITLSPN